MNWFKPRRPRISSSRWRKKFHETSCKVVRRGADPAGHQRSEHTGVSTISLWKHAGWNVRTRAIGIEAGIQAVRCRLMRGDGSVGLRIHQRCKKLIEAMTMYRYPADHPDSIVPLKDGPDHAADALRYMIVNLDRHGAEAKMREY